MKTYYKKVAINAIQYLGNVDEIIAFTDGKAVKEVFSSRLFIGNLICDYSDYITKEFIDGELHLAVYRSNIFEQNNLIINT